jgi:hypothetical protein
MFTPAPREMARSDAALSLAGVHRIPARKTALLTVTGAAAVVGVVLAAVGGMLALGMVRTGRDAAALQRDSSLALRGPAAIGQDLPTSFGVVAVESMTKSAGPTAKALAGVTHGIQNLVPPNKIQIDATVTLTNTTGRAVRYTPAQFSLYATRGDKPGSDARPIHLSRASVPPGTLQPQASVDATLTYIAPRNGSKLWISFHDAGRSSPALFDLGRIDRTPPGALLQYQAHRH